MAGYPGQRDGHVCHEAMCRCRACGARSCSHDDRGRCINQAFAQGDVCQRCEKGGTKSR